MTIKEIQDLVKMVNRLELAEFKMKDGEFELLIRTKFFGKPDKNSAASVPVVVSPPVAAAPLSPPVPEAPMSAPTAPAAPAETPTADTSDSGDAGLLPIISPIVGTFYRSSSPDKDAFVKVGDTVDVGSVVCIVEAMKLFNEIESEVAGKIVKVMVEDASPVEYEQVLFLVDPKG